MLVAVSVLKSKFQERADSFDLSEMEKMEAATVIYDRNGTQFGKIFIQNRNPIFGDDVPELMKQAVIAAEDNRFMEHNGVDYWGILRAAIANYRSGRKSQGASTVTQQLARNSFDMFERTYERKFIEILLANRVEERFSKDQIMEMYLNRVYFGSGLYGVEAAAKGYFGVAAKDLTAGQCATLAGLLKSPNGLSPWNNPEAAKATRDVVLGKMEAQGFITKEEERQDQLGPMVTRKRSNPFKVSYAVDYVRQQAVAALGYERAMNGGFKIFTTLDLDMQRAGEVALRKELNEVEDRAGYDHETYAEFVKKFAGAEIELRSGGFPSGNVPTPRYVQGAVIAYHNPTGGILTLIGGREFTHSEYNRALQAKRSPGTAFTPLVFAAGYEEGIFPGELVQDAALDNRFVNIGGTTGILGEWGVERADNEYEGNITAREALVQSKNAATVRFGWRTGLEAVTKLAERAGITSAIRQFSGSFLGTSEVSLDELTLAYTMFPGYGWRPENSFIIQRIEDGSGRVVYEAQSQKVPVVEDSTAYQVHVALDEALHRGTGAVAGARYGLGDYPAAGKTGTAYDFTDAYFIGYTSEVTCGVWVGFDKPQKIYRGAFGNELALPIWTSVMNASVADFQPQEFARPESVIPLSICRKSGLLETGRCEEPMVDPATGERRMMKTAYIEYATEAQKPRIACDVHGSGMRSYAAEMEESEWPRAASAIDLAMIRPIGISEPALVGLNDVYGSVRPAAMRMREDEIPVAKALPVDQLVAEAAAADGEAATAPGAEEGPREVRKAQLVRPMDVRGSEPAIAMEPPGAIEF
jgi:penicillin-binding protein 1A